MHKHLQRLDRVWIEFPIYSIMVCTFRRRPNVVMPDHMHFFCASEYDAKTLSDFIREWKSRTCRRVNALLRAAYNALATRILRSHLAFE